MRRMRKNNWRGRAVHSMVPLALWRLSWGALFNWRCQGLSEEMTSVKAWSCKREYWLNLFATADQGYVESWNLDIRNHQNQNISHGRLIEVKQVLRTWVVFRGFCFVASGGAMRFWEYTACISHISARGQDKSQGKQAADVWECFEIFKKTIEQWTCSILSRLFSAILLFPKAEALKLPTFWNCRWFGSQVLVRSRRQALCLVLTLSRWWERTQIWTQLPIPSTS